MADYPTREYIIRETTYPDATKQELVGELVRCRDCKRWDKYHNEQIGECKWTFRVTKAEGYCNYGERKDGDNG